MSFSTPSPVETAAILVIGDEVLSGKTQDSNSHWLAGELYALGVALEQVRVIPDRVEVIAAAVRELAATHGALFTSGGIGPTHDDVTYAGVAQAFDLPLRRHPELETRMRAHYGDQLNPERLKMAELPHPAELCFVDEMITPVARVHNVYVLPGVPSLFRQLFGALRESFRLRPVYQGRLYTRQPEGDIAALLNRVVADHPGARIGSYPHIGDPRYRVKLVVESHDRGAAEQAYLAIAAGLDPAALAEQRPVAEVQAPDSSA